jgi:SpoVK/Ycf46/Vps4 family AAA+-type ATPase
MSPPGCGKSACCKALGKEVGRPVLNLDVGSLMGALVGQSEERTRQALRVIDATAPCVAMIDEVEKAFAGMNGSGDSGVALRMFGTFLSWLNNHESDVFVVCTANGGDRGRVRREAACLGQRSVSVGQSLRNLSIDQRIPEDSSSSQPRTID